MSGRIPREFIDELLVRVDIVDLIDSHVPLKKTGTNYVARCPFHTEKTPSFSVNRNKQFFHCFGCGVSGNAISFLMDFSHLDFIEAVEDLAAFVGVDVPRESVSHQTGPKKNDLNSLYVLMEQVAAFYVEQLRTSLKAVDYLKARGVKGEVARDFMVGYAPDKWSALAEQFNQKLLLDAGLLVSKDDGQVYDRFRGRIMFPIRDKRARIVGFGGRVLDDSLPKYLNSPETSLFHKGKEVYGLYELLESNSKPQKILIVEGYMDVIALAQYGIDYAVAALGTAASQAHLDLLFRFSSELVFCFDGDRAGREAAWKVMESAFSSLKEGRSCRIMLLPQSHDPDSLIRDEGLDKFVERVQTAQALSDYFFEHISEELNLSEMEGRAQLIGKAKPYLEKLPEGVFRDMMFSRLKELSRVMTLNVLDNVVAVDLNLKKPRQQDLNRLSTARVTIALLLQNPRLASSVDRQDIDWSGLEFRGIELFKNILQVILDKKFVNTAVLVEYYRDSAEEKSVKALALLDVFVDDDKVEEVFFDALKVLLKQGREAGIARLQAKAESKGLDSQEQSTLIKMLANK
ncbi:DNA primase [Methylobacter sp. S3L5C]|uniref:DNA primase n=1 Tax=Methylobacter sp. S3L5C TaxID=2839024 RepID=UPI001FAD3F00|nr:DNA primase [Methylobacter sp. S3L5C]UOA09085.1 DNA primase [Methylobacter sp. S3L5C]